MANETQRVPTNIGNKENSLGKELNIIISNGSEIQFAQLESSGTPVQVKNALIIAIPQDSNGNDIQKAASLWLSDKDGYLLELAKPISETSSGETISQANIDALYEQFVQALNTAIQNAKDVISREVNKQFTEVNEDITKGVQNAHNKINSINEYLDQNIHKVIWANPNIAYLAYKVRTLCEQHQISFDLDNEYSDTEVLHNEHHSLEQRITQLEEQINQLTNGGH